MRTARRTLWLVFALALLGDLALGVWLVRMNRYGSGVEEDLEKKAWLVGVRTALTSAYEEDARLFELPPEDLLARGFRSESQADVDAWAVAAFPAVPYLQHGEIAALPADPIERSRALALLYSKNGGPGCGHFRDIAHTVREIADGEGQGCCVDHARAFVALGQAAGLTVRTVRHGMHTFSEVWAPGLGKWVFIDTQYALMARDPAGEPLSTLEIRTRKLAGDEVRWDFFGNEHHEFFARKDPYRHKYYASAEPFRELVLVWGTNFLEQDRFFARLGWLPKAPRELVARAVGVMPRDVVLADEHAQRPRELRSRARRYLAVVAALALDTTIPPIVLWGLRRRVS